MAAEATGTAVIYTRISSDRAGAGLGVQRQEDECRALAGRLGLEVARVYSDNDMSAFRGKVRPGYTAMLEEIEAGTIRTVLCWHTDRLTRSPLELERYISACERHSVLTHTVSAGPVDLTTQSGLLQARIAGAVAAHESGQKAERIRSQKRQAAAQGKYLGGPRPTGWERREDGTWGEHPLEARLIREGTAMVLEGRSLGDIARHWAAEGFRSRTWGHHGDGGREPNTTQVRRMLVRERNAGMLTFHGEVMSTDWPALVTLEDYRECVRLLKDPRVRRSPQFRYLLSGLVFCWCGRRMTGYGAKPDKEHPRHRRMYRCTVHAEASAHVRGHAYRNQRQFDDYVSGLVVDYLESDSAREAVDEQAARMHTAKDDAPDPRDQVDALRRRKDELADMYARGVIDARQLERGTEAIREELAALEAQALSTGANRAVVRMMAADSPGAAFMDAPLSVQREVIRALLRVDCLEGAPGGKFDPSFLRVTWHGAS